METNTDTNTAPEFDLMALLMGTDGPTDPAIVAEAARQDAEAAAIAAEVAAAEAAAEAAEAAADAAFLAEVDALPRRPRRGRYGR